MMQNNVKKPVKSIEDLFDFVYQPASNIRSNGVSPGGGQCIDGGELEITKESINQLRQRLHLLIIEPECNLVSEEVLSVSRALDELIHDYQRAFGHFIELAQQQERMIYQDQDRRCCYGRR